MANLKASKRDILINRRNRARNLNFKSRMKTFVRRAMEAIESDPQSAQTTVQEALRIIDKTAGKGIIKKQTAARHKSRLAIRLNKALAGKPVTEEKPKAKKTAAKKAKSTKASTTETKAKTTTAKKSTTTKAATKKAAPKKETAKKEADTADSKDSKDS